MKRAIGFGICAVALTALVVTRFVWAGPPSADADHKVAICHKSGKVLVVDRSALAAHLAHGDCLAPTGAIKGADCDCCELDANGECDGDCFDDDLTCTTTEEVVGECVDEAGNAIGVDCRSDADCDAEDDEECVGFVPATCECL